MLMIMCDSACHSVQHYHRTNLTKKTLKRFTDTLKLNQV